MRLSWEAAGPRAPPLRRSASSSAFPIDVDGDSDELEGASATATTSRPALPSDDGDGAAGSLRSPPMRVPVAVPARMPIRLPVRTGVMRVAAQTYPTLRMSARAKRPLKRSLDAASAALRRQSSSDESDDGKQSAASPLGQTLEADDDRDERRAAPFRASSVVATTRPSKPPLNFFFNAGERASPQQKRRERHPDGLADSAGRRRRPDSSRSSSARSSPSRDEAGADALMPSFVRAARSCVCGQLYGRCELTFLGDRVNVLVWQAKLRVWEGAIKYSQLARFCFSRGERPPYVLLLELEAALGHSDFATFYDTIYARVEQFDKTDESLPHLFGLVLYFDEQMDYVRCRSMGENNARLAGLFAQQLSEKEAQQYLKWDVAQRQRGKLRRGESAGTGTGSQERSLAFMVGSGAKQALESVSSFFKQRAPRSVLETTSGDERAGRRTNLGSLWSGNSLSLAGERHRTSASSVAKSPRDESPIQVGPESRPSEQEKHRDAEDGVETVVLIPSQQQEPLDVGATAPPDVALRTEEDHPKESKKRKASQRQDEEIQAKRRKLERRRNEVLLSYPYEDAELAGRISVTLGDIDRLAPGEFLNDNLIDFYLRFLWRHLDPWQQQQMYFFSSHFFTQLNGTNGAHELSGAKPEERYARVARWTSKETELFDKRFLFIPINDSFHWSIAVFCNPSSAIIKKRRRKSRQPARLRRRSLAHGHRRAEVVDLVDTPSCVQENGRSDGVGHGAAASGANGFASEVGGDESHTETEGDEAEAELEEEEVASCLRERLANPPCLLFLDSLRCHRKKKFSRMLRDYLACEWKARFASRAADDQDDAGPGRRGDDHDDAGGDAIVASFDPESIALLEPSIPLQSNSSDCGVFLLMYAAAIVRNFPAGITREDLESHLSSTLTPAMFGDEHVLEFRDYLRQLLFCLKSLQDRGLGETHVRDEDLEEFAIE